MLGKIQMPQYKPQFPEIYALLLSTYSQLMKASGEKEAAVWDDRLMSLCTVCDKLKNDGGLSAEFRKSFALDVADILQRVNTSVELRKISNRKEMAYRRLSAFALKYNQG